MIFKRLIPSTIAFASAIVSASLVNAHESHIDVQANDLTGVILQSVATDCAGEAVSRPKRRQGGQSLCQAQAAASRAWGHGVPLDTQVVHHPM